jgi:hypothetical protein
MPFFGRAQLIFFSSPCAIISSISKVEIKASREASKPQQQPNGRVGRAILIQTHAVAPSLETKRVLYKAWRVVRDINFAQSANE